MELAGSTGLSPATVSNIVKELTASGLLHTSITSRSGRRATLVSLAPIIAAALLQRFDSWVPVAIYLAIAAAITLVAVISMRETKGSSLHELDRLDEEKLAAEKMPADA